MTWSVAEAAQAAGSRPPADGQAGSAPVGCQPVRDVLAGYLRERQAAADSTSRHPPGCTGAAC